MEGCAGVIPLWFSVPANRVRPPGLCRHKVWSTHIPGNSSTYVFPDEASFMSDYQDSWLASTWKRTGWDCMRHVEILAGGAVPVFAGVSQCPRCTMVGYPKQLLGAVELLVGPRPSAIPAPVHKDGHGCVGLEPELAAVVQREVQPTLADWVSATLTCGAMVTSVFQAWLVHVAEPQEREQQQQQRQQQQQQQQLPWDVATPPRRVLFVDASMGAKPDYMSMMVLIGLLEAFPSAMVHTPFQQAYLFDDYPLDKLSLLYGKGFNYARTLSHNKRYQGLL